MKKEIKEINASLLIHPDELSYKWIDRIAENHVSTLALHPPGGIRADETLLALCERLDTSEYRKMIDYAKEKGISVEYEMHSAGFLLPKSEFEAHPEYFRMTREGERSPDLNCCPSCDEALDIIAENAVRLAKSLYGSTERFFFWLDDTRDGKCHCPRCRELSASDQQLMILNRIIKRLRKDIPNASLAYLAYMETIAPPTTVKPEDGIFLEYAPFNRDFHKPLCEDSQSEYIIPLIDFFGAENAKALDYWYDNSLFSRWKKPPKPFSVDRHVLFADFEYYSSLGFSDIGCFACFLGADYEELHGKVDISDFSLAMENCEKV